ncbi:MAG: zinc ribbon domain-containing protein [Acidimicrobiales bacterium]
MTSPTEPARCPVCDHPVGSVDRFCARCGHDLSAGFVPLVGEETGSDELATAEASVGPPRPLVVGVAAAVVLVVVLVAVTWLTGTDDPMPEQAEPAPAPTGGVDTGDAATEPGVAQEGPRRTEIRPGPTPEPPMLGEESGLMVVIRAEEGILVVDLDTGERVVIDEPDITRDEPTVLSTMALFESELWTTTADGLRAFDLRDDVVEVVQGSSAGPLDGPAADDVVGFGVPTPSAGPGVVVALADGSFLVDLVPGGEPVPFLAPVGFEVFGAHRAGVVLTHPEIGGAWLLGAAEQPRRITTALPLAVSAGGVLVLDCDDDLICSFDVVDVESGETVRSVGAETTPTLPEVGTASLLAPDGSAWLLTGQGTTEQVVDLDTGQTIPGLVTGVVTAAAFSPDSRWLFLAGDGADRALLTALPVDFSLPQRTIATEVALGAATEILVFERPDLA